MLLLSVLSLLSLLLLLFRQPISAQPSQEDFDLPNGLNRRPRGDLPLSSGRGRRVLLRLRRLGHHRAHQQGHLPRGRRRGRRFKG